jgi:hypothetical protein
MYLASFSLGYTIETVDLPPGASKKFMTAIISDSDKHIFRQWYDTEEEANEGHNEIKKDFEENRREYIDFFETSRELRKIFPG